MCIGPLSTLTTKLARRITAHSSGRVVLLSKFTTFAPLGTASERPTITTGKGASATQKADTCASVNDFPSPRENGCSATNEPGNPAGKSPVGKRHSTAAVSPPTAVANAM